MDENGLRYAAAGTTLLLLASVGARSLRLRRAGVPVNQLGAKGNFSQRALVALAPVFAGYLAARAPFPAIDALVAARPSPAPAAALAIMILASFLIIIAQGGMGKSWRVGVPSGEGDVDRLVTGGLNKLSRNPTYLGIMLFLIGAALAAPGPLTAGAIVITFALLSAVIDKEEKYLRSRFGAEYDAYARRVRRWI